MRAYKFLPAQFAMKSLRERRLKISRIDDLNDPFELLPFDLSNPSLRWAVRRTIDEVGARNGLLCFSAAWHDPVIWAHYADKHKGVCLGFEVPDQKCQSVKYVADRIRFPTNPGVADTATMLFTKYAHWQYEQELRIWVALNAEENGLYYADFGPDLRLCEIIVGARCNVSRPEVFSAAGDVEVGVSMIKARAGFTRFEVVRDRRGLSGS